MIIKDLRNRPSYELHEKLEKLYEEVGIKTKSFKYVDQYPGVSFEVNQAAGNKISIVWEDLAWVRPAERDLVREEERLGFMSTGNRS